MKKNIFFINSGVSFIESLALGIKKRFRDNADLREIKIFLPTKKSVVSFEKIIIDKFKLDKKNLPEIISLGDFSVKDNNNFFLKNNLEEFLDKKDLNKLWTLISEVNRSVLLSKLINQWKVHQSRTNEKISNLFELSEELGNLLDESDINQFNKNAFKKIIPSDLAFHWRDIGSFLNIIIESWPKIAEENNLISKADNYYYSIEKLIRSWEKTPPSSHVIIAGSTGSVPITKKFIKFVSKLPKGMIIIPGVDKCLDDDSWDYVAENHPQFNIKSLLIDLKVDRKCIIEWIKDNSISSVNRDLLVSQIMMPLEKIDNWRKFNKSNYNLENIYRISCSSESEEARIVSSIIDEKYKKTNKNIALVTTNRAIVRRVINDLKQKNIKEINSHNNNLTHTIEGNFILLGAKFLSESFSTINLLSLLKNKLSLSNHESKHISSVMNLEKKYLRKPFAINSIEQIINIIDKEENKENELYLIENGSKFKLWLKQILNTISEFREKFNRVENNIKNLYQCNVDLILWLNSEVDFFSSSINSNKKNQKLIKISQKLNIIFDNISDPELINKKNYTSFLFKVLDSISEERSDHNKSRVNIWTPFESRLHKVDVVILSDLNEDSWPSIKETSPWLSLNIRKKLGINIDQKKISLLAHDFVQNFCTSEVYLTRSTIKNRKQTSPSRWLVRINNLIGEKSDKENQKEKDIKKTAYSLYKPVTYKEIYPPLVYPPVSYRPRSLSVSDIDTLINNPYALYIKKILRIQPLNPITFIPDISKQGQFIHNALDIFSKDIKLKGNIASVENLIRIGKNLLRNKTNDTIINSFWLPRFEEIASWCINNQRNIFEGKLVTEERGNYFFKTELGEFELKGKADRIEILNDGFCGIVDYKTASIPTKSEIEKGIKPQLQLLGLIAEFGKFENIDTKKVNFLSYLKLSSSNDRGWNSLNNVSSLIIDAEIGLKKLISEFEKPETPYLYNPWQAKNLYDDYQQLSRYDSWSEKI